SNPAVSRSSVVQRGRFLILRSSSFLLFPRIVARDFYEHRTDSIVCMSAEFTLTCRQVPGQSLSEVLHQPDAFIQLGKFDLQVIAHAAARTRAAGRQYLPDFIKREAEILRLLDELHALHCLRREETESPFSAWGGR